MIVNAAAERALDLIARRAADAQKAFTPGAMPQFADAATTTSLSRAELDPMSASAPDGDYFVTTHARGRTAYTRDGKLTFRDGAVCASNGKPMLGYVEPDTAMRALRADPVDVALGRVRNMRVEMDGTIAYDRAVVDPRTGVRESQRVAIGRLALARFPAATKLVPGDDATMLAPADAVAHLGRAGDGNFGTLQPMRREQSRVDFNRSLDRLHDAYIAFDALLAAHKAQGHTGKVAMDLLK